MIKRYLLLFLIINFSLLSMGMTAKTEFRNNNEFKVTEALCLRYADLWLQDEYNDGTVIDEAIPIIDADGINAYAINFKKDDKPNGYIVLSTSIT